MSHRSLPSSLLRRGDIQHRAEQIAAEGVFLGGPVRKFERVGLIQLELLKAHGLKPHHRVLDIGAGALRPGVWLVDYVNPGNYFAIEPNQQMVEAGLRIGRLAPDHLHVDHNDRFDLTVFDTTFDFGLARSIWTHASLKQIEAMLDSWREVAGGPLFASYRPAILNGYRGSEWVGISHKSATPGMVRHRLADLQSSAVGFRVEKVKGWKTGGQRSLKLSATP